MLGRRRIDTRAPQSALRSPTPLSRSRSAWSGAAPTSCARVAEVVKWPFERVAWAIERGCVWPLRGADRRLERARARRRRRWPLALLAAGAGVLGLRLGVRQRRRSSPTVAGSRAGRGADRAAGRRSRRPPRPRRSCRARRPTSRAEGGRRRRAKSSAEADTDSDKRRRDQRLDRRSGDVRQLGRRRIGAGARRSSRPGRRRSRSPAASPAPSSSTRSAATTPEVRTAFGETATPAADPARCCGGRRACPADVKVPKAKVLNVVPGPRHGDTYTLSVSLLRVGVTSELRLDMQRDPKIRRVASDGRARLMGRLRNTLAVAAVGAALTAPARAAEDAAEAPAAGRNARAGSDGGTGAEPARPSPRPAVEQGDTLAPPSRRRSPAAAAAPRRRRRRSHRRPSRRPTPEPDGGAGARRSPAKSSQSPRSPSSSCAASGVPPVLIPIYQRAAAAYGLGPQGAAILAAINEIETAFGTNLERLLGRRGRLDAVHALDLGQLRGRRQRRRGRATPTTPKTRSSPPPATCSAAGHAGRHLRRDLRLQPRRLVRRRGARQRLLLRRAGRRRRRRLRADAAAAGLELRAGRRPGARRSPPTTWTPSRTRPAATNSAGAASGRWPRSPGWSRTSAAA